MLLSVEAVNTKQYGVLLDIYEVGGKRRIVKPPILPYFYSLTPRPNSTPVKKRLLSTLKEVTLFKCEFKDTHTLDTRRDAESLESHFPFIQKIAVDVGYYFPSPPPKVQAWDAESFTEGLGANPHKDVMRSTATWGETKESRKFGKGKQVVQKFIKNVRDYDADVLVDYYGRFYDIPLLIANCNRLRIKCNLGRDNSAPYIVIKEFERRGKGKHEQFVRINGRVHFDVHKEVEADYSLTRGGLKSRTLNNVAQYYGLDPITDVDHANIPEERLEETNMDDARCTYEITKIYLGVLCELAEYLSVPLNMIIDRSPSHIPNYIYGREYKKRGIVSDGANKDRFPKLFIQGCKAHQGAFNECYETGVFGKVRHYDYSSFYACTIIAFNLDPETVKLIEVKPYTGEYKFEEHDNYAIVEVPDKAEGFSRQVVCRIDLSFDSVSRTKEIEILKKRKESKADWVKNKNRASYSKSIALKLVGNLMWGYHSMRHSRWGSLPVGILIAALARYIIKHAVEKRNATIIQVSTDGWYETDSKDDKVVDLSTILPTCFDLDAFKIGFEDYGGMISIDKKDYVLYEDGKVKKYGAGLLGKHQPRICDKFVDDFCMALFKGESIHKAMGKYVNLAKFPAEDFVITVRISKNPERYAETTMYAGLVKQYKRRGINLRWGDNVRYVKTTTGYVPVNFLRSNTKIDFLYYKQRLAMMAARIKGGKPRDFIGALKNMSLEGFS